jgi:hypothetical protein
MPEKPKATPVNGRLAVQYIRSSMSNAEIMEKFNITAKGFADLLTQLVMRNALTQHDLEKRGIRFRTKKRKLRKKRPADVPAYLSSDVETVMDIAVVTEVLAYKPLTESPKADDDVQLDTVALSNMLTLTPLEPSKRPTAVVKVRFGPDSAHLAKDKVWFPEQDLITQKDGSVVLSFQAPIDDGVVSWILGFGAGVEVMEPASLKKRIVGELQGALKNYGIQVRRRRAARLDNLFSSPSSDPWNIDRK